jgi:hypothetical protein
MANEQDEKNIVENLARHEEAIGRLYDQYAKKFPQSAVFWNKISQEENEHAHWLRRLNTRVRDGSGHVNPDRFRPKEILASMANIEKLIDKATNSDLASVEALQQALKIEQSMLENKYFEVFGEDSPEIKQVLIFLAEATRTHCSRISDALSDQQRQ